MVGGDLAAAVIDCTAGGGGAAQGSCLEGIGPLSHFEASTLGLYSQGSASTHPSQGARRWETAGFTEFSFRVSDMLPRNTGQYRGPLGPKRLLSS